MSQFEEILEEEVQEKLVENAAVVTAHIVSFANQPSKIEKLQEFLADESEKCLDLRDILDSFQEWCKENE